MIRSKTLARRLTGAVASAASCFGRHPGTACAGRS